MKNGKHAYLIMAHNNFLILEKLVKMLDDPRNDIYIHINKRVKKFNFDRFRNLSMSSKLVFVKRLRVDWGGYSQIKCVLSLLKAASRTGYDYYHLISGVDLPLKTQDQIHEFFDQNYGKEFVHFDNKKIDAKNNQRLKYFYFMRGRADNSIIRFLWKSVGIFLLTVEKFFKVNRLKNHTIQLQKGSHEYSITDSLAKYIISKEALIKALFQYSSCGDEMFVQTLVWNSKFKTNLYNKDFDNNYMANMRFIDWERGKPYTWRVEDFQELINSDYLFARKFNYDSDYSIVKKIYNHIMNNQLKIIT